MSKCSNCYSNCVDIQPDKCVKYTGVDIVFLGISNGDNLNSVTGAITDFLATVLDGIGIVLDIDPANLCTIITNNIVDVDKITALDITRALSVAICDLDTKVTTLQNFNTTLEANYTPDCVPEIDGTEGTHAVLQAVVNHLCTVATALDAVKLDLSTNYVAIADINTYIANYIAANFSAVTGEKAKMVPYTVVEYYGPLNVFDATGAGLGDWAQIYLCNGENGTPDKRGRIAVGTTNGMGGGTYSSATDPLIPGNPTYNLYSVNGSNTVTLTESQIPSHTHTASVSTNGTHTHDFPGTLYTKDGASEDDNTFTNKDNTGKIDVTSTLEAGSHTHTVTNSNTGGGNSHNNVPPVLACHYIMYIPTV